MKKKYNSINKALLLSTTALLLGQNAYALEVHSPYVEKGIMEIESKNRFDLDSRQGESGFRQHQIELGYGITSRWAIELAGEMEKEPQNGYKYTATEIENIFQLTEVGEYWADLGLQASYEFAHPKGSSDKVEVFLLAAKNINKFTTMLNIGFEKEVGDNSNKNPEGEIKWMAKYNYLPKFSPGVEYYGEFGEIGDPETYSNQKHRLGPVIYGQLAPGFKYDVGTLFGISKSTPDYTVKVNLEYEFPVNW